jgi:uncharacterized membrane protein
MELEGTAKTNGRYLWLTSLIAAIVGLVDSIYLAWIKLADKTAACSNIGDCEAVNNSQYSEIGGIPIALLGAGAFLLILILLVLEQRWPEQTVNIRLGIFGLSLTGTLYSGYLTYLEIAVLRAICPFCVVSAIAIFVILTAGIVRLRSSLTDIY